MDCIWLQKFNICFDTSRCELDTSHINIIKHYSDPSRMALQHVHLYVVERLFSDVMTLPTALNSWYEVLWFLITILTCIMCDWEYSIDCWYRVWIFYGKISTVSVDLFKFYVSLNDIWQCQVKSKNKFLMLFHLFVQVKLVSSTNKSTLMAKWRKI